jgi:DNA-binding SARP family transcriptional activator
MNVQERPVSDQAQLAQGSPSNVGVDPNQSLAVASLQQALTEQQLRAETIRCLLSAVDEQHARLGAELSAALGALSREGCFGPSVALDGAAAGPAPSRLPSASPTVVRCLGPLEVQVGGMPIETWRSGKARAVFEYLVTHRRRPVPRDTLIQALWPDPEALASGTSLKVAVHALRQIFTATSDAGNPPVLAVIVQESSYQIQAPDLWLDVEEFERCCALGAQLDDRGQAAQALGLYARAAELYRGDFLPESWDEWAIFRREGLKDLYLFVLARLADARLQAGDYQRCIQLCRQLLEQDCCREDTFRMLMVCHARLGQRGRVKRWYELCVQTLRSALDIEPEPETMRVYAWASRLTAL